MRTLARFLSFVLSLSPAAAMATSSTDMQAAFEAELNLAAPGQQ